jgi:hypothetical protein
MEMHFQNLEMHLQNPQFFFGFAILQMHFQNPKLKMHFFSRGVGCCYSQLIIFLHFDIPIFDTKINYLFVRNFKYYILLFKNIFHKSKDLADLAKEWQLQTKSTCY